MSGEISIYIVQYNLKKSLHIFYFFIVHNISTYFILLLSLYNSIVKETLLISVITYMSYLLFSVFTIPHRAIKIWIAEGVHHQRVKSTFCHFFYYNPQDNRLHSNIHSQVRFFEKGPSTNDDIHFLRFLTFPPSSSPILLNRLME